MSSDSRKLFNKLVKTMYSFIKKHKIACLSIASLMFMAAECVMSVDEVILPENATPNTEEEITVKIRLVPGSDESNSKLAFAFLTPKSWKSAQNAKLTFSTAGYTTQGFADVVDEEMELIPDTETEPSTALSWPMAYQSKVGLMDNKGPVEWTVFRSKTAFTINDQVSKEPITATIKIRIKTGPENIKFFFGAGYTGAKRGLMTEQENSGDFRYVPNEVAVPFTVKGGSGAFLDYTVTASVTTTPSVFRYGDIFAVNYIAEDTELSGKKVYLCGKAVLSDGSVKEVITPSEATLMNEIGEDTYQRYIYPRHFFSVPEGANIESINVWSSNADGSVIVKEGEDGILLNQSEK